MVPALIMTNELHQYTYTTSQHTKEHDIHEVYILKSTDTYSYSKILVQVLEVK